LENLLDSSADIVLAVDTRGRAEDQHGRPHDLVSADHAYSGDYLDDKPAHLRTMSSTLPQADTVGEWMGLARFSALGTRWLAEELGAMAAEGLDAQGDLPGLLNRLAVKHPVRIKYFTGHWMDVDTLTDVADARNFT
jgi:phosphoenolpyruvate phosphomutase